MEKIGKPTIRCANKNKLSRSKLLPCLVICVLSMLALKHTAAQDATKQGPPYEFSIIEAGKNPPKSWVEGVPHILITPKAKIVGKKNPKWRVLLDVTGKDLEILRHANNVNYLQIEGSHVTGAEFRIVLTLDKLKKLEYEGLRHANDVLSVIGNIEALERLVIENSKISNKSMRPISQLKNLKYLDMKNTGMDSTFFEQEFDLPQSITHLRLDGNKLSNSVIEKLPKGLTHLALNNTDLKPDVIPMLKRFRQLKILQLHGEHWRAVDIGELEEQLPWAKVNTQIFSSF